MQINLTPILEAVIGLLAAVITYWLIPWIKSKTSESQQALLAAMIRSAVYAAEQIIGSGNGPAKMEYVRRWLEDHGIDVETEEIEAAVYECLNRYKEIFDDEAPPDGTAE